MTDINWMELWFLNELVISSSQVARLLCHGPEYQSSAYWCFPGRDVFKSNRNDRADTLRKCIAQGFIDIYSHSCLLGRRFESCKSFPADKCQLHDNQFVTGTEAFLTLSGYQKWEAEFQPDWKRYWRFDELSCNENTGEMILSIYYSSDVILEEILEWLPFLRGLESEDGLIEIKCSTRFQYQVTTWRLLPFVKVIECKAVDKNIAWRNLILNPSPIGMDPEQGKKMTQEIIERHAKIRQEKHEHAKRILLRLSGKWDCVRASKGCMDDSEPKLRS